MMPEYVKAGIIDEITLKKVYVTWVMRLLLKAKPKHIQPHRIGDLIHFNRLVERGGIKFDTDNKIVFDFEKFHAIIRELLEETILVQLSKSTTKAKQFIDDNSSWGEIHEYIAKTLKSLGIKPYKDIRTYL